jgi:hypothetical protein
MTLMDFSNIEKEITNAPAPHTLPKGTEAQIRLIGINEGVSEKNGAHWFMPRFDVPSDPMVKEFNSFFWNPSDNGKISEKQRQMNNYSFQQFTKCFGIDLSKPFAFEDLIGKTGWAILGVLNDEYGEKNTISKYVTGASNAPVNSSY